MIKLVLPSHPDPAKIMEEIGEVMDLTRGYLPSVRTEITHNGINYDISKESPCWDLEVYAQHGHWSIRVVSLTRTVNTADMLFELMLANNGEADAWIRCLLGNPDADGIWDRYHREVTV